MKKVFTSLAAAGLVIALASPAYAFSCPKDLHAIDAALEAGVQISSSDMAKVKSLRDKGEAYHKSGAHAESIAALKAAKKILGM